MIIENFNLEEQNNLKIKKNSFLVLTYLGEFIDKDLLHKGLYYTKVPNLYNKETTIDLMITNARTFKDMNGNCFINEEYFENLSKCELTEVDLLY